MEQLSTGILSKIINGETINYPIFLQFLGSKLVNNGRYRLWLSDGSTVTSHSLMSQDDMNLITDGILTNFAVCKITSYILRRSTILSTPVIMVRNVEVVASGNEIGSILGNPITYEPKAPNIKENVSGLEETIIIHKIGQFKNFKQPKEAQVQMQHPSSENEEAQVKTQLPVSQNGVISVPIMSLSPYYGKWTIRARVSAKTEIKHWHNERSHGKLFSLDLIDESGEIRCTGFNEQVDSFYDLLEVGYIYYITKCHVKPANKQYTTIKHEFELVLNSDTAILIYEGDSSQIPMIQFDFSTISDIELKEINSVIDVLAVVKTVGDVIKLKSKKTGADLTKRDILLVDDSNAMIQLTLWGAQAEQFNETEYSAVVVAVKSVKIQEFNRGKTLSTLSSTIIQTNPTIPDTERLLMWFRNSDQAKEAKMLSSTSLQPSANCPWLNFRQVEELNIGVSGTVNTFLTIAAIGSIKYQNALYKACPTQGCKKKLMDPVNGMYRCPKCAVDFPNFIYRMIIQATLLDFTQELNVTIFESEAEVIIKKNAQDLGEIYENLASYVYEDIFNECTFKRFIFKILMKQDYFNNISRVKPTVLSVSSVNETEYSTRLGKSLKSILEISSS